MKSSIATICILGLAGMVVGMAVQGAEQSVTATVTVQNISVTVSPNTIPYGTLPANTESDPSAVITATNNGNVTENFNIYGAATTPGGWTLGATAGNNVYVHKFSTDGTYTTWTPLTTSPQALATNITAGTGTDEFELKITTPTTTSDYSQQSAAVTVQATI